MTDKLGPCGMCCNCDLCSPAKLRKATDNLNIVRLNYADLKAQFENVEAQLLDKNREYLDWKHALKGLLPSLGYHKDVDPEAAPQKVAELAYAAAMGWEDRAREKFYDQQAELEKTKRKLTTLEEEVGGLYSGLKDCHLVRSPSEAASFMNDLQGELFRAEDDLCACQGRITELSKKLAAIHVAHQGPVPGCSECEK